MLNFVLRSSVRGLGASGRLVKNTAVVSIKQIQVCFRVALSCASELAVAARPYWRIANDNLTRARYRANLKHAFGRFCLPRHTTADTRATTLAIF